MCEFSGVWPGGEGVVYVCVCVCVQEGGGSLHLSQLRPGSRYLFLIWPSLCGFPAVTGLRVETGTNEQLHPACLPGIMGLQADRASVCALFRHSHFVICPPPTLNPHVQPYLCF